MSTLVYVSNAESGSISVLQLDEHSGALSTLQTVEVGGMLMPMAVSRDKRFLYVARRSEPLAVVALGIDAHSGQLTRLGEATLPASMANISLDASGRWLFSASYGGNLVGLSPIGADGLPQPAKQVIPTGPKAHAMYADPGNRFVFATSLGAGQVLQFMFDAQSGELVPNVPPALTLRPEAGPRHFVFPKADRQLTLAVVIITKPSSLFQLDGSGCTNEVGDLRQRKSHQLKPMDSHVSV